MKPAPFAYTRPDTLEEALASLAADPHAKVLAGGQSLVPLLSMRLAAPTGLVDLNGLDELAGVRTSEAGVRVGALARHAEVEGDAGAEAVQPLLASALRLVAHPTIRNRGTTVGSLVHADPAAELPTVLLLLGGSVTVASTRGVRTVEAGDLFLGPLETTLRHDEVATEAFFPALPADAGVGFEEISRRHGDYALCGAAAVVRADEAGAVTSVRVGYLSVSQVPVAVDLSEVFAAGRVDERSLDDAAELALASLEPEGDIHATAAYRAQLARVLTRRVVRQAHAHRAARGADPPRSGGSATRAGGRRSTRPATGSATGSATGTDPATGEPLHEVRLKVNDIEHRVRVPARRLLSDALRHDLGLTGTHVGCEHGVCGACTVLLDGRPVRACLLLAVSVAGQELTTVEGLADPGGVMGPVQRAFRECHALQCGFCTPGFLTTVTAGIRDNPDPSEDEAREMVAGNLCRCTGYQGIVASVARAAEIARAQGGERS